MKTFLEKAPRFLFFAGKGGVGKTSMSCAAALGLSDRCKKVLLISTDPASNLKEVLQTDIGSTPTAINGVPGLSALNINPIQAAAEYREGTIAPYRGVLPESALAQMEEQLSGACTVEIAGFNEFSKFLGNEEVIAEFDHVVLDTAPTGHTLRLLSLPSAWNDFIAENDTGSSCLGPVSGLAEQRKLYEQVVCALKDPDQTLLVLVTRAESMSLKEAARASRELGGLGLHNQHLVVNGVFEATTEDPVAQAFAAKSRRTLQQLPPALDNLERTDIGFRPHGVLGIASLRDMNRSRPDTVPASTVDALEEALASVRPRLNDWASLLDSLESSGRGVIMTMGKGGVGKTTIAAMVAVELASRGHTVTLSTTDPASHIADTVRDALPTLQLSRIDPKVETERHVERILEQNRGRLSADDFALLEEELRSPCVEEIAVFMAFADTVAHGEHQFVVMDTAPTGHTLLLLDSTEAYHREVAKSAGDLPDQVHELLPRIRDPEFTRILIVALAEATPAHEAEELQRELQRAGIDPYAWVINRSFAVAGSEDPVLCAKGLHEVRYIREIAEGFSTRTVISPWMGEEPKGVNRLRKLSAPGTAVGAPG